jgi:hypothetical protein
MMSVAIFLVGIAVGSLLYSLYGHGLIDRENTIWSICTISFMGLIFMGVNTIFGGDD